MQDNNNKSKSNILNASRIYLVPDNYEHVSLQLFWGGGGGGGGAPYPLPLCGAVAVTVVVAVGVLCYKYLNINLFEYKLISFIVHFNFGIRSKVE